MRRGLPVKTLTILMLLGALAPETAIADPSSVVEPAVEGAQGAASEAVPLFLGAGNDPMGGALAAHARAAAAALLLDPTDAAAALLALSAARDESLDRAGRAEEELLRGAAASQAAALAEADLLLLLAAQGAEEANDDALPDGLVLVVWPRLDAATAGPRPGGVATLLPDGTYVFDLAAFTPLGAPVPLTAWDVDFLAARTRSGVPEEVPHVLFSDAGGRAGTAPNGTRVLAPSCPAPATAASCITLAVPAAPLKPEGLYAAGAAQMRIRATTSGGEFPAFANPLVPLLATAGEPLGAARAFTLADLLDRRPAAVVLSPASEPATEAPGDAARKDSDGDAWPDLSELSLSSDPFDPRSNPATDDDADGVPNFLSKGRFDATGSGPAEHRRFPSPWPALVSWDSGTPTVAQPGARGLRILDAALLSASGLDERLTKLAFANSATARAPTERIRILASAVGADPATWNPATAELLFELAPTGAGGAWRIESPGGLTLACSPSCVAPVKFTVTGLSALVPGDGGRRLVATADIGAFATDHTSWVAKIDAAAGDVATSLAGAALTGPATGLTAAARTIDVRATRLLLAPATTTPVAGVPFSVTASVRDAAGNVDIDFTGRVTFSATFAPPGTGISPNGGVPTIPAALDFGPAQAGVASVDYRFVRAGVTDTILGSSPGISTGSASVSTGPAPLFRIVVSGASTLVAGTTATYALAGFDSFANHVPLTRATVSHTASNRVGADTVAYTEAGVRGDKAVTVVADALSRIVLSGPTSVVANTATPYDVLGFDRFGNSVPLSAPSITFQAPRMAGKSIVTYAEKGVTGSLAVEVVADALGAIVVDGPTTVVAGTTRTYSVSGFDRYGNPVDVATPTLAYAVPTTAGPASVAYSESGVTGSLAVEVVHAELHSIAVAGPATIVAGTTRTYALAGSDRFRNVVPLAAASLEFVAPQTAGPTTVQYEEAGVTGRLSVAVLPDALARIDVTGPGSIVAGTTAAFGFEGFDRFGNRVDLTETARAVTAPSHVGSIDVCGSQESVVGCRTISVVHDALVAIELAGPTSVVAGSLATYALAGFDQHGNDVPLERATLDYRVPQTAGPAEVAYDEAGVVGWLALLVRPDSLARIDITGPSEVVAGSRTIFALSGFDRFDNSVALTATQVDFDAPSAIGQRELAYTEAGIVGRRLLQVVPESLAAISIEGPATLAAGSQASFRLRGSDRFANAVPLAQATLLYDAPTLPGPAVVEYSESGIVGRLEILVVPAALARLDVSGPATAPAGGPVVLSVAGFDRFGNAIAVTLPQISTLAPTLAGETTFHVDEAGIAGTWTCLVVPGPLARIQLAGPTTLFLGETARYDASGIDAFGNAVALGRASIEFTAVEVGDRVVTYDEEGIAGRFAVEVRDIPPVTISKLGQEDEGALLVVPLVVAGGRGAIDVDIADPRAWLPLQGVVDATGAPLSAVRTGDRLAFRTAGPGTFRIQYVADRTPPGITIDGAPTEGAIVPSVLLRFLADEAATFGYSMSGGPSVQATNLALNSSGVFSIEVQATDPSGNVATRTLTFRIDAEPPVLSAPSAGVVESRIFVRVNATDASNMTVGAELTSEGGTTVQLLPLARTQSDEFAGFFTAVPRAGLKVVLRAVDAAGNSAQSEVLVTPALADPSAPTPAAGALALAAGLAAAAFLTRRR